MVHFITTFIVRALYKLKYGLIWKALGWEGDPRKHVVLLFEGYSPPVQFGYIDFWFFVINLSYLIGSSYTNVEVHQVQYLQHFNDYMMESDPRWARWWWNPFNSIMTTFTTFADSIDEDIFNSQMKHSLSTSADNMVCTVKDAYDVCIITYSLGFLAYKHIAHRLSAYSEKLITATHITPFTSLHHQTKISLQLQEKDHVYFCPSDIFFKNIFPPEKQSQLTELKVLSLLGHIITFAPHMIAYLSPTIYYHNIKTMPHPIRTGKDQ